VPILIARWAGASDLAAALTGLAALMGAWRSVFLRFHGGRGVAAGTGGMLAVSPAIVLLALPVFMGVIWRTGYVSLGSLLSVAAGTLVSIVFVALGWLPGAWLVYTIVGTPIVWLAHRDNIARLLGGTERRFTRTERSAPLAAPAKRPEQDSAGRDDQRHHQHRSP
jgi:glycerol-3-phosphate acyltransferase PlsY